jgi:signal transduction histidine kinase/DNA-binding response OmpR family regulator
MRPIATASPAVPPAPGEAEREVEPGRWVRVETRSTGRGRTVALCRDVSQDRRQRALLGEAIEALDEPFSVFDADERLVAANAARRGYSGAGTPGSTLEAVLRAAVADRFATPAEGDAYVIRRLAGIRGEGPIVEPWDGPDRWTRTEVKRLASGGRVIVIADITELKRREQELEVAQAAARRAEERLTQAIEALDDAFAIRDAEERLVICNTAYRRMNLDVPEATTPGQTIEAGLRALAARHVQGGLERQLRWVKARLDDYRSPSGTYETRIANDRIGRAIIRTVSNGDRVGVTTDITELKRHAEELAAARDLAEDANRAKSAFLATVSHEIRTPMNGVLGMMEVLERQGLSEEQRQSVSLMRDSATSLLRIIDDILDFSKIEAGRLDLEAIPFAPRDLIGGIVDTLSVRAEAKRLVLIGHVADPVPERLVGDPTRIRQILFNLVGNALKFTERGFVRVSVDAKQLPGGATELVLAVEDSGIGMSSEALGRLFVPFAQADSSTTRRFGGSGLGLSIVKRLAELMDGDVKVDSTPGRGSTFTVTLRLAPAQVEAPALKVVAPSVVVSGRVLVVDDHPVNREVLSRQLALLGVGADSAEDGAQGLAAWQTGSYAALLVDLHMPAIDGYELARRVRAAEAAGDRPRTPIVAVTANALMGESERCLAAGMDAFLTKPTTLERLNGTLARWMAVADAETRAESGAAPAFDRGALHALFGDDRVTVDRLLVTFRESAQANVAEIDAAISRGDLETATNGAHRIKGAARSIGANALADAAQALEQAGKAADADRAQTAAGKLAAEFRRVELEL